MSSIYEALTSEWFWLPGGVTWTQMTNTPEELLNGMHRPQLFDQWVVIPLTLILFTARFLLTRFVFPRIAAQLGLKEQTPKVYPITNTKMERIYVENHSLIRQTPPAKIKQLSIKGKQYDVDTVAELAGLRGGRRVLNWIRLKKKTEKLTEVEKFCDCAWLFVFYCPVWFYTYYCLFDQPWYLRDPNLIWTEYPAKTYVPNKVYYLYMIQLANYVQSMVTCFYGPKRKDFVFLAIHHFITYGLLFLSYNLNWTRIGLLVLFQHDVGDWLMNALKMSHACNMERLNQLILFCFVGSWFYGRIYAFSAQVFLPLVTDGPRLLGWYGAAVVFIVLLGSLLLMQIMWTFYLLKFLLVTVRHGRVVKDTRSESDESSQDETDNVGLDRETVLENNNPSFNNGSQLKRAN